ncbi:hypothetical protein ACV3UL_19085 [Clostridium perfringens]
MYEIYFIETKKLENGYSVVMCQDEILEKYKDLEKKCIDNILIVKTI